MYIVCVCVCVCVRERERERERSTQVPNGYNATIHVYSHFVSNDNNRVSFPLDLSRSEGETRICHHCQVCDIKVSSK